MAPLAVGALDLVEEAYATACDEQAWLARTLEVFTAQLPRTVGWGAYTFTRYEAGVPVFSTAILTGVEDAVELFTTMHRSMSPALAELVYPTGTRCNSFVEDWTTAKTALETDEESARVAQSLLDLYASYGGDDLVFASSCSHSGSGVFLGAIVKDTKLTGAAREANRLAAVHLAAGLRLRRALAGARVEERSEAVLEVDGRVAHADGPAAAADMREVLQRAVRNIDRARTRSARQEQLEALNLWLGLVEGRWSVIDRHDTDGRRYYVAVANPPEGVAARQLSDRERRVVAQAIVGEPNGIIAYSLGIAPSTVSTHLRTAMRKLGVTSRVELVRLARSLGALDPAGSP